MYLVIIDDQSTLINLFLLQTVCLFFVSISSVYSCTDANTTKLLGTLWTTVHQFLMSFSASICIRPVVTQLSVPHYRLSTYGRRTFSVAGPTVWNCPKTFGIRSVVLTVTDSRWRHFYFGSTSVFSALEVNGLYKFTFDIWHWLDCPSWGCKERRLEVNYPRNTNYIRAYTTVVPHWYRRTGKQIWQMFGRPKTISKSQIMCSMTSETLVVIRP